MYSPADMAGLRAALSETLLKCPDFAVGGGLMRYSESRPNLLADLDGLSPAVLGLPDGGSEPAQVMVALVLIARGALDAAHDIVGELGCSEATYAHAMIHRREGQATGEAGLPGYSNSRYWFVNLGDHPLFPAVQEFAAAHPACPRHLRARAEWNPAMFVGLCDKIDTSQAEEGLAFCIAVQQREWEMLFDYCAELVAREREGRE